MASRSNGGYQMNERTWNRYDIANIVWMNIGNVPGLQNLLSASHVRDAITEHIDKVLAEQEKDNG